MSSTKETYRLLLVLGPPDRSTSVGITADLGKTLRYPPMGLLYLAAFVGKHRPGWQVRVLDCQAPEHNEELLENVLAQYKPHVVGLSCFANSLISIRRISQMAKRINPLVHVIAGGAHVLHYPEEIADIENVDWAVCGEGEKPLVALLDFIAQGGKGDPGVSGVYCACDGAVSGSGRSLVEEDLDLLPHPDRSMLPIRNYYALWGRRSFCTSAISSRGCPFHCVFCDIPYKNVRLHSPAWILQDVKNCLDLGIREIHFFDDNFNIDPKRATEIACSIHRQGLKLDWSFRGRVDRMDPTMLRAARKAGCYRAYLGLESGSDRILTAMRKQITLEDIRKGVAAAKKAGLEVHGYFMLGFEDETFDEVMQTIDLACSLGLEFASFTVVTYGPGMAMYENFLKRNPEHNDPWLAQTKNPSPDFVPPVPTQFTLGQEEIWRLNALAYRRFYLRPGAIWRTGKSIRSPQAFARRAMGALSALQMGLQSIRG
ncbi:MAG: radical SAM protein [Desulfatibacillaceae bacterium]|nr:radical SAM protein [Desulfatibacillaceae bacterium]